jgi:methylated-DNA-[protein]-cysteine S-methyltransferase
MLTQCDGRLTGLWIEGEKHAPLHEASWVRNDAAFAETRRQLDLYFAGKLESFSLPLQSDGTEFQRSVWAGLREIPYGETWSYAQLAKHIGRPKAMRAVGAANGRNPISIVVPCHRVIGADRSLTGYGGGLEAKVWLLKHEQRASELALK